jgi:Rieske Fe-S protein
MKRRALLAGLIGVALSTASSAHSATKKPMPKATKKPTPKTTARSTPKPTVSPTPQVLPVLRDGEFIKIDTLIAPVSFYATVTKGEIDYPFIVSKPTERVIKIFTARCPHQGQILNLAKLGEFTCDRHSARFNEVTGRVTQGPTIQNLIQYEVIDRNCSIYITF